MLLELRVKNLGIIEDMTWTLRDGLNVITGETGAGKSLVIDAVELLLSGKADEEVIRFGANEAQIEGIFTINKKDNFLSLSDLLAQKDLADDEDTLVINCQLRRKAPCITRVNGHAVPRTLLHKIGRALIDIHGQSEHLSLLDTSSHRDFLDSYAHAMDMRNEFSSKVMELRKAEQELKELEKDEEDSIRREEFLRFQIDEIKQAKLRDGEEEELERERNILSSIEKLKALSYEVYQILYEGDVSHGSVPMLDRLNEAIRSMKKLVELDSVLEQQMKLMEETAYSLTEVARDVHTYNDRLNYDPDRLEEIESRLEQIRSLKRKYGQTVAAVLDYLANAENDLVKIGHYTERRVQLEKLCTHLKQELGQMAYQLSQERSKAANQLVNEVKKELHDLNMQDVDFEVSISQQLAREGIPFPDGKSYAFSNEGVDTVEFMVSTNQGEPLKPLARIASTGELSRFTLALKGALSESDKIPVLIFDEIDIGIGGRSGEIIGKKLWILARNRQVICVTHLPQIAAFADAHFSVHKVTSGNRTLSILENLDDKSRIKELAVMITGPQCTEISVSNACELIQKAELWKKSRRK